LRVYALEARLPKISTSAYLINIIIYHPLIKLSNNKLRHRRKRTHPLRVNTIYIKTYD
jgi:hypothetical protein